MPKKVRDFAEEAQEHRGKNSPGYALSCDLAKFLQSESWMTWVNIPLGSVQIHWNTQIADVLAVFKSFTTPHVRIYEVKVSRADFQADINAAKYAGYLKSCNQLYFATPAGLVKATEIPEGCGLVTKNGTGWHYAKGARRNDYKPQQEILLKLLMKGYEDHCQVWRPAQRDAEAKRYTTLKQAFHDYGVKVARDIATGQELVEAADEIRHKLSKELSKDFGSIEDALAELTRVVNHLMRQRRSNRLAVTLADLAMELYDGRVYGDPVRRVEQILSIAKLDFAEEEKQSA